MARAKAKVVPPKSAETLRAEVLEKKRVAAKALMELVDKIQEEKKVSRDVIFGGIESAIQLAAQRHFMVEEGVHVAIDRATGDIVARHNEAEIDPETLGRIAAQSAKQVMIQKIREAESDTVFNEFNAKKGELVVGTVQRVDAGTAIVSLGKSEALLPRSEQIPGETHHVGDRVKAVVFEVRRNGQRVKIVLSRAHQDFVKALFQEEIPEVDDRTIDIKAIAREAGYRTKMAVVSIDSKVDAVGACVGVRGSRIKNIIEELNGERIDIVRWNESLQILVPNSLSPADISDVFTYPRLGRAIVLVAEDQLSLAIGRRGQNVRLASHLVGMDIEIMTHDELGESLERAERWFRQLPNVTEEQVQAIVEEGFLSYTELGSIDGEELMKFAPGLTEENAAEIIDYAEEFANHMDRAADEERAANQAALAAAEAEAQAAAEAEAALNPPAEGAEPAVVHANPEAALAAMLAGHEPLVRPAPHPHGEVPEGAPAANLVAEGMPTDSAAFSESLDHNLHRSQEDGDAIAASDPPPDVVADGATAADDAKLLAQESADAQGHSEQEGQDVIAAKGGASA